MLESRSKVHKTQTRA